MPFDIDIDGEKVVSLVLGAVPYIFGLLIIFYAVLGMVLDYHWRRYGVGLFHVFRIRFAYIACGVIFIGIMGVAVASL